MVTNGKRFSLVAGKNSFGEDLGIFLGVLELGASWNLGTGTWNPTLEFLTIEQKDISFR